MTISIVNVLFTNILISQINLKICSKMTKNCDVCRKLDGKPLDTEATTVVNEIFNVRFFLLLLGGAKLIFLS